MSVLETAIEKKFVAEAKKLGCLCRKLNGSGNRNWPDQLVLIPGGVKLLIEFKRPGEGLRPAQEDWHREAVKCGHESLVYDSWEAPLQLVKSYTGDTWSPGYQNHTKLRP